MPLTPHPITTSAEWHTILPTFPQAHPLQSWAWGEFKSRWGWQMQAVVWRDERQTAVACALILRRPIPRTPWAIWYVPKGPIVDESQPEVVAAVLTSLEQLARHEGAIALKIDPDVLKATGDETIEPVATGVAWENLLRQRGWHFSAEQIQFRNTVTLDLGRSEEELLAAMHQKTRYNIRLAAKKEVVVREGTAADLPLVYQLYAETAARDGFLIRPRDYYLDGWQTLLEAGLARPLIAEYEGTPLGAVIIVACGQKAIYMYGASTDLERQRMPNYLLQWEAIRWAKNNGYTTYDFWGAPDEFVETDSMWGVWRFKKGFNGLVAHHIGAWDFPVRPWLYWAYSVALPRYVAWLKGKSG